MATVKWKDAASGFWFPFIGSVWDTGTAPGAGDDVYIDVAGSPYTVTLSVNATVANLFFGASGNDAPTLEFVGGSSLALTVTGNLLIASGTVLVGGDGASAQSIDSHEITVTGGILQLGTVGASNSVQLTTGSAGMFMSGGTVNMNSNQAVIDVFSGGLSFLNGGLINARNLIQGNISGQGGTISVGDSLGLTVNNTNITGSNTFQIGAGANLTLHDGDLGATNISFTGATGTLRIAVAQDLKTTGTISGMQVGAGAGNATTVIDFNGIDVVSASYDDTTDILSITDSAANVMTLQLSDHGAGTFANWDTTQDTVFLTDTVCYAAGTRILTNRGEVAVEDLRTDDMVVTVDGAAPGMLPVKWIGTRHVDLAAHPAPDRVVPVRIARDAFADNVPSRDLVVSPPHALAFGDHLIPAKLLVNDMTITREWDRREVTYYHVELDRHAIILANGLGAESYLDTGNRTFFSNVSVTAFGSPVYHVDDASATWQAQACAPLAVAPHEVRPRWQDLADRAGALGYARPSRPTTTDPDLHLLVDGRRVNPIMTEGRSYQFLLPRNAQDIILASRAVIPSRLRGWVDDDRRLGIALRTLTVRSLDGGIDVIAADAPVFVHGWHQPERLGAATWRWTDGFARLPVRGCNNSAVLEVIVADTTHYDLDEALEAPELTFEAA